MQLGKGDDMAKLVRTSMSGLMTAALASGLMLGAAPAAAHDDRGWHRDERQQQWRDGRGERREWRQERRAYRQGFRDGRQQARRAPVVRNSGRNHGWNNGWNNGGWQAPPVHGRPVVVQQAPVYGGYPVSSAGWQQGRDYWFDNGRYYCRRPDGTVGLVVGAVAGGTLGNILAGQGDKTLGSLIGGTLGAIVGKEIARGNARCR